MNIKAFNQQQQQAILDLLTLAMYADGHLATAEDERVRKMLDALDFASTYERDRTYDDAVSRIRPHARNPEAAKRHAQTLAQAFFTQEQRSAAQELLEDLISSDGTIASEENNILLIVRHAFAI